MCNIFKFEIMVWRGNYISNLPGETNVLDNSLSGNDGVCVNSGVDHNELTRLYDHATGLFNSGLYESASRIYYLIVCMEQNNADYWLALGLCYQRLNKNEDAILCFNQAGAEAMDDPRPAFFAGMSYRVLGKNVCASKSFDIALQRCGEYIQYQGIRYSAAQLLAHCILENSRKDLSDN